MRNVLLLFILTIICAKGFAQEINFKIEYKPEKVYKQSTETTTKSEITYSAPKEFLDKLEEKGVDNPTLTFQKVFTKTINRTGKLNGDVFPLNIEFVSGENPIIPNGTKMFGHVKPGQTPVFDSISAPKMEAELKDVVFNSLKGMVGQLNFPERKVKVGGEFTQEMPFSFPIGKNNMAFTNNIIYKLIKVENDKAFFDIHQTYTLNSNNEMNMKGSGSGPGHIIYDIKNSFYLLYELTSTINMEIVLEKLTMNLVSESYYKLETEISK